MIHSLKHTWITIFSILAMLMSNYVSSAPMMTMSRVLSSDSTVSAHSSPQHHSSIVSSSELSTHSTQNTPPCHSMNDATSGAELHTQALQNMNHCGDSGSGVDSCCISICASVSYPTGDSNDLGILSSSLALHQSIKIGAKVMRIQGLLRPPSA